MSLTKVTNSMIRSAPVNVLDYMTDAQITAVQAYTFVTDVTAACQLALNDAFAANLNCYFPAGGYLNTGLFVPGRVSSPTDDRGKAFRIYGQGTGEAFVLTNLGGTVFKSITNAPVLQDYLDTDPSSNGSVEIDHIRFDGTSTTPVVKLQSFFGMAHMHDCVVFQRGVGDGIFCSAGATGTIERVYSFNKDWATYALGAARVGVGFNIAPSYDQGLLKISKCTSRGWLTSYNIGGGLGTAISYLIDHCECSVVRNGIIFAINTNKCVASNCYVEGGDGGVGVNNLGNYNTIRDNLFFAGFAIGIQDLSTSNIGTLIEGNTISIGATVSGKGVAITSSASFGGYNKNVLNNSIAFTDGTAGVYGIELSGTDPRINILGNSFDPRGNWTGASSNKILDLSSNGVYGIIQKQLGEFEIPVLSHGAISVEQGPSALTQADVSANVLTIPTVGSYFLCNATSAATVQSISAGVTPGRVVVFRTQTANMTFQDTAFILLNGNFTGPGTLTLMIDRVGGTNYAYEIARTVF